MADSFRDGCYDPKNRPPDQLYPLLYKTSAAAEIELYQLHFYGTKKIGLHRSNYFAIVSALRFEQLLYIIYAYPACRIFRFSLFLYELRFQAELLERYVLQA